MGYSALNTATTAHDNIVIGYQAGVYMTTGGYNTLIGKYAGRDITTSDDNVAIGYEAALNLEDGHENTCVGRSAGEDLTTGGNNLLLGKTAGRSNSPSGSLTSHNNMVCLGNNDIDNIYCANSSISTSDQRDKTDFTEWTHGLDWINKLKPITYRWDKRSWYANNTPDGSKKTQRLHLGFKAQEVLAIEQADGYAGKKEDMLLINLNEDDTAYGMKYERLVVVLTKAVQELSAKVTALEAA